MWVNEETSPFSMKQCVTSCALARSRGYNSCHDPTLLPEFHDVFHMLCSHKLRGSNICEAVLAIATGNSSGSVWSQKGDRIPMEGIASPPPCSPVLFKHSNRDILTVQRKMRRKEQRLCSVLWRRSDFWF